MCETIDRGNPMEQRTEAENLSAILNTRVSDLLRKVSKFYKDITIEIAFKSRTQFQVACYMLSKQEEGHPPFVHNKYYVSYLKDHRYLNRRKFLRNEMLPKNNSFEELYNSNFSIINKYIKINDKNRNEQFPKFIIEHADYQGIVKFYLYPHSLLEEFNDFFNKNYTDNNEGNREIWEKMTTVRNITKHDNEIDLLTLEGYQDMLKTLIEGVQIFSLDRLTEEEDINALNEYTKEVIAEKKRLIEVINEEKRISQNKVIIKKFCEDHKRYPEKLVIKQVEDNPCYDKDHGILYFEDAEGLYKKIDDKIQIIVGGLHNELEEINDKYNSLDKKVDRLIEQNSREMNSEKPNAKEETLMDTSSTKTLDADDEFRYGMAYVIGRGVEQNYKVAAEWFEKSAKHGHIIAQFNLGQIYRLGRLGEPDFEKAFEWYLCSAKQGYREAQFEVGEAYYLGQGTEKNIVEAVKWFKKAANQEDAVAQFNLGQIYRTGELGEPDFEEAFKWYLCSAKQGYMNAQLKVGYAYDIGQGKEQDIVEAVKWYKKAADQGDAFAQYNLGYIIQTGDMKVPIQDGYEQDEDEYPPLSQLELMLELLKGAEERKRKEQELRDKVAKQCDLKQIPNSEKAFELYLYSAKQGYKDAQFQVGYAYDVGLGVKQNINNAVKWYKKAAEQGDEVAQYNLGEIYHTGELGEPDYEEAFNWYLRSAKLGYMDAQFQVGFAYGVGQGVEQDIAKAFEWYKKAAEQGHAVAQYNLGQIYRAGELGEPNYEEAFNLCLRSAKQGYREAQLEVARALSSGNGVERNESEAKKWMEKATNNSKTVHVTKTGKKNELDADGKPYKPDKKTVN